KRNTTEHEPHHQTVRLDVSNVERIGGRPGLCEDGIGVGTEWGKHSSQLAVGGVGHEARGRRKTVETVAEGCAALGVTRLKPGANETRRSAARLSGSPR